MDVVREAFANYSTFPTAGRTGGSRDRPLGARQRGDRWRLAANKETIKRERNLPATVDGVGCNFLVKAVIKRRGRRTQSTHPGGPAANQIQLSDRCLIAAEFSWDF